MVLIGLTGGIGSGKSTLLSLFESWNLVGLDVDDEVKLLYQNADLIQAIAQDFPGVQDQAGLIDKAKLRSKVFQDPALRQHLESLIYPRLAKQVQAKLAHYRACQVPLVFLAVPLLFEKGLPNLEGPPKADSYLAKVDRTLLIWAEPAFRIERACLRDGAKPHEIEKVMATQMDPQVALKLADDVIENSQDKAALEAQARSLVAFYQTHFGLSLEVS